MKTNAAMAWEKVGNVLLLVHAPRTASDAEWNALMDSPETRGVGGAVVLTNGARPSPLQRGQIQDRFGDVRTAVVTNSMVTRGAVTALGWFGLKVQAFAPNDIEGALSYAGVPERDFQRMRRLIDEMSAHVVAA